MVIYLQLMSWTNLFSFAITLHFWSTFIFSPSTEKETGHFYRMTGINDVEASKEPNT